MAAIMASSYIKPEILEAHSLMVVQKLHCDWWDILIWGTLYNSLHSAIQLNTSNVSLKQVISCKQKLTFDTCDNDVTEELYMTDMLCNIANIFPRHQQPAHTTWKQTWQSWRSKTAAAFYQSHTATTTITCICNFNHFNRSSFQITSS